MGLKCAGKKIHDILLQQGSSTYPIHRLEEECFLLSQIQHPNIVQFLGLCMPKDSLVPILVKSNVWSFGIIVWEIMNYCRSYPYPETSEAGVLDKLKQGYRMTRSLGCPDELYRLMNDCWKDNANSRPTFEALHW